MKKIEKFILEIESLRNKLNSLEGEFIEFYQDYEGNEFDNQNRCAAEIENLTLMLTHETSNQMAFGICYLQTLIKYIDFRKKYNEYNDEELSDIIDDNVLNIKEKKKLTEGKKEKNTIKIKSDWNKTFDSITYEKLKIKLRLKHSI